MGKVKQLNLFVRIIGCGFMRRGIRKITLNLDELIDEYSIFVFSIESKFIFCNTVMYIALNSLYMYMSNASLTAGQAVQS